MAPKKNNGNGWSEYQRLVMSKLDSHDRNISDILKEIQTSNQKLSDFKLDVSKDIDAHKMSCKISEEFPKLARDIEGIKASLNNIRKDEKVIADNTKDIGEIKLDVARLQVKSGLWGAIGGIVGLAMVVAATWFKNDFASIVSSMFPSSHP